MKMPLKLILYFLIIFCLGSAMVEGFRYVQFAIDYKESVNKMLQDSMDFYMDDDFRNSHVSYVKADDYSEVKEQFFTMLRHRYDLDSNLMPRRDTYIKGPVEIRDSDIQIYGGTYKQIIAAGDFDAYGQDTNPSIEVTGKLYYNPMIFHLDSVKWEMPFHIKVTNFQTGDGE